MGEELADRSAESVPLPPLEAGRRPAGRALLGWLADVRAPRLCRVAGSSGSGRSHLLRWLAEACPPEHPRPERRVNALVDAAGSTPDVFVWEAARRLGVAAATPEALAAALADGVPRVLLVADLDRAGGGMLPDVPERIAVEVLRPLLGVPSLRLVVECASGAPAAAALDVPAAVLDLDDPQWTDPEAFSLWTDGLANHRLPPAVHPSPALALLAARTAPGTALAAGASAEQKAEALAEAWWLSLSDGARTPVVALAGTGGGLDVSLWAELPGGGGPAAVHGAAAALLPPDGEGRYRVWPEALAARLAVDGLDHLSLRQNLLPEQPGPQDADRLGLVLRHAVRTGSPVEDLLADPAVLVHADPTAVDVAFRYDGQRESDGTTLSPLHLAWRLAGPLVTATDDPRARAAALRSCLPADPDGTLAKRLTELADPSEPALPTHEA